MKTSRKFNPSQTTITHPSATTPRNHESPVRIKLKQNTLKENTRMEFKQMHYYTTDMYVTNKETRVLNLIILKYFNKLVL